MGTAPLVTTVAVLAALVAGCRSSGARPAPEGRPLEPIFTWSDAILYVGGGLTDEFEDASRLDDVASLGFNALAIARPAEDARLAEFADDCHARGVKLLSRVEGELGPDAAASARRAGVDGFFLEGAESPRSLEAAGPDVLVVSRHAPREPFQTRAELDLSFHGSAAAFLLGREPGRALDHVLEVREVPRLFATFLSLGPGGSPAELGGDASLVGLAAVLQTTALGIPTVEAGPNRLDERLRSLYAKLIRIRLEHVALRRGRHIGLVTDGDVYVFVRDDWRSAETIAVVVNRSAERRTVRFKAPAVWTGKLVYDLMGSKDLRVDARGVEVALEGRGARILTAR